MKDFLIQHRNKILTLILLIAGLWSGDIIHARTIGIASFPQNLGKWIMWFCFLAIVLIWLEKLTMKDIQEPAYTEQYQPEENPFQRLMGKIR